MVGKLENENIPHCNLEIHCVIVKMIKTEPAIF
jgi:hypothetical protein